MADHRCGMRVNEGGVAGAFGQVAVCCEQLLHSLLLLLVSPAVAVISSDEIPCRVLIIDWSALRVDGSRCTTIAMLHGTYNEAMTATHT